MNWLQKTVKFLGNHWWYLSFFALLIISFGYFTFIQAVPAFPDPDSFYHIKMALLIPEKGIIKSFPWLQFTILKNSFIDQHFLYHVFLIPFTRLLDPILGAKLANVVLSVALTMFFYWFLRRWRVKFAFLFTLILLATTPFTFRINLVKAPVMAVFLLLVGLYLIFRYKYLGLFFLSFIYVWAYGGFILILVFSGIYALVCLAPNVWQVFTRKKKDLIIWHSRELRLFFVSLAGVVSGLVINPYFPQNFVFYWHQLVKIGIINYQKVIPVGNEWYPYKFIDLTAGSALVTIIILIALFLLVMNYKRPSKKSITLFMIFLFFMAFTLKSRRYVEYYIPFALLFGVFTFNEFLPPYFFQQGWRKLLSFYNKQRALITILGVYFLIMVPVVVAKDVRQSYRDFKSGISVTRFAQSSAWLKNNSQPGDIVFHTSWDEFPILFYFNDKDYYIAGLDPTFTYEYDKDLYKKMVDITVGTQKENLYQDLKNNFHASYVFVEKGHRAMDENIRKDGGFQEVYQDEEATVYKVISNDSARGAAPAFLP